MSLAQSKLTAQGQISVPAKVRQRLGVGPGSILEWDEHGGEIVVRKGGQHSLADTRSALGLRNLPKARPLEALREGLRDRVRSRHARR
jgi:AbrB family looped-hinge helix DNA binding protein